MIAAEVPSADPAAQLCGLLHSRVTLRTSLRRTVRVEYAQIGTMYLVVWTGGQASPWSERCPEHCIARVAMGNIRQQTWLFGAAGAPATSSELAAALGQERGD
jgi:hypothetical protein